MPILKFKNEYRFLSNFWKCHIIFEGGEYTSTEAAYQSAKTLNKEERKKFILLSPADAKRMGKNIKLRDDWEEVKVSIMQELVRQKFETNSDLMDRLLATKPQILIEGNLHHDTYWGWCFHCHKGENKLGEILMDIRDGTDFAGKEYKETI